MFGLIVFGAMGLYLLLSIGVVVWAVRHARKHGKSTKRWGWGAAFVMYNLVFWDWLPTVAMHKYYCSTQAGFWVYKTLDQWKAENPGVLEALVANEGAPSENEQFDHGYGKTSTYLLNKRFNWIVTRQDISTLLPIIREEQQVKDLKKGEVLARYVGFSTGNSVKNTIGPPGPLRFWLTSSNCNGGQRNDSLMWQFTEKFMGAKK